MGKLRPREGLGMGEVTEPKLHIWTSEQVSQEYHLPVLVQTCRLGSRGWGSGCEGVDWGQKHYGSVFSEEGGKVWPKGSVQVWIKQGSQRSNAKPPMWRLRHSLKLVGLVTATGSGPWLLGCLDCFSSFSSFSNPTPPSLTGNKMWNLVFLLKTTIPEESELFTKPLSVIPNNKLQ